MAPSDTCFSFQSSWDSSTECSVKTEDEDLCEIQLSSSKPSQKICKRVQIQDPDEAAILRIPRITCMRMKADMYYSEEEYDDMVTEAKEDARDLEENCLCLMTNTARGLERRTRAGIRERQALRRNCRRKVLEEQDRQWESLDISEAVDDEAIRSASREETHMAAMIALSRAAKDAQEAQCYFQEEVEKAAEEYTDLKQEDDQCTTETMNTSSSTLSSNDFEHTGFRDIVVQPFHEYHVHPGKNQGKPRKPLRKPSKSPEDVPATPPVSPKTQSNTTLPKCRASGTCATDISPTKPIRRTSDGKSRQTTKSISSSDTNNISVISASHLHYKKREGCNGFAASGLTMVIPDIPDLLSDVDVAETAGTIYEC